MNLIQKLKKRRLDPKIIRKYRMYEAAVQTPEQHVAMFALIYSELRGRMARVLREDFCGTFALSRAWIERDPKRAKAIGVDLDLEPLTFGVRQGNTKCITLHNANVLDIKKPKADVTVACNFSFFVFKTRPELVEYFKAARESLDRNGILLLEMAGGPGMIEKTREQMTFDEPQAGRFTYFWDQKKFDPITAHAEYAIHFKKNKKWMKNAFTYDWRVWTVPEVKEALLDAGFREVHVYWEVERQGEGTGEYVRATTARNHWSYICYVVGAK